MALGALVNGATFCSFTYLAPVVTDVAGLGAAWVPAVLAVFGVGSFAGIRVAARFADSNPRPLLTGGATALLGGSLATASLNVGAAGGPWLGGVAIAAGLGLRSPLWMSAALVAAAIVVGSLAARTAAAPLSQTAARA
jgi:DHA1 family chloramphenicol resistance protein-like MFS transporter